MRLFYILIFILSFHSICAQRVCLTDTYTTTFQGRNNNQTAQRPTRDTITNELISIPVVIHLLYNTAQQNISEAQILSQLTSLNNDFRMLNEDGAQIPAVFKNKAADTRIKFCLAQVDPKGRATSGIIRKQTPKEFFTGNDGMKYSAAGGDDAWDAQQYLNIWVCNMAGKSLGYASLPGGPLDKDGVVISWDVFGTTGILRAPFNKGRTATHEIAHWLGLKHIWGDEICGSDDVDDTPKQKSYNFYCPTFPQLSSCSSDGNGDMYMNFMDLTDDACMNMFTYGQKNKMRALFSTTGHRNSFLDAFQCDSSLATGSLLPEDTTVIIKATPSVRIYPNPVINYINLIPENDFVLDGKICEIYSIQGKKLLEKKLSAQTVKLEVSFLPPGVYFLKISEGTYKKTLRIIKL